MSVAEATVLITTRNRKDLLDQAIRSALMQRAAVEILVVDDGSTDGTSEFVQRNYPSIRLISHATSAGYVKRRNEGIAAASADYVFSIDDDAQFTDPDTVSKVLSAFDEPEIWAVAIPFINILQDKIVRQKPLHLARCEVTAFYIGTAHAIRRSDFLDAGGYRCDIVHQGEEGDIAIRMLEKGKLVALADTGPIHHLETPRRDFSRVDYYGARNALLFGWRNVPAPELLGQLAFTTANLLRHVARMKRPRDAYLRGMIDAYRTMFRGKVAREPVSRSTFWTFRWLVQQPRPIEEVRRRLDARRTTRETS